MTKEQQPASPSLGGPTGESPEQFMMSYYFGVDLAEEQIQDSHYADKIGHKQRGLAHRPAHQRHYNKEERIRRERHAPRHGREDGRGK